MDNGLSLRDVEITAPDGTQLLTMSADVPAGSVMTIMGPSGVGKSTLLAWLTGTLAAGFRAKGTATLNGRDLSRLAPQHRGLGILFQDHLLFPHLSVAGNLAFGLAPGGDRAQQVEDALEHVGLQGYGPRDPASLSGGQRARVALMRMLLSTPGALLLDEPFSRLDAELRVQMRDLVFELAQNRGLPVVLVTHDIDDATAAGGQRVILRPA
ncbi:MAG: ATP-binding cassette domain-containing protein [Planktomarina sp.]